MLIVAILFTGLFVLLAGTTTVQPPKTIVWKLKDPAVVGGVKTEVLGAPMAMKDQTGSSIFFNGIDDGLILPVIPVSGWPQFTIEVLINPAAGGPAAPRFLHFEDEAGKRGTLELRVTPEGNWYMDSFLKNGATDKGLTLIKAENLHPCGKWYWLALAYDGKTMRHYVNAAKELEGEVAFGPAGAGRISLGVRLNKVNWYKGLIREIRFHPMPLDSVRLQRIK